MSKPLKQFLFASSGLSAFLILTVIALLFLVDANTYKPRLQEAASKATGMEVTIDGRLGIDVVPGLHLTLEDVHVHNQGAKIVSVQEARLWIEPIPLFRRNVRIGKILLKQPRIFIERGRDGNFNIARPESGGGTLPDLELVNISLADGTLTYADRRSGKDYVAEGCSLDVPRLRISGGKSLDLMKHLLVTAELACGEIRNNGFTASDLTLSVAGKDGIFDLDPVTMQVVGAQGLATIQADYSGAKPHYHVHYSLPKFDIEEFFKTRSMREVAAGPMDFSADLSLRGESIDEVMQTAEGKISLRSDDITLLGRDIDRDISQLESSQSFSLIDAGALLFAGPFGLVVTKGFDVANVLQKSEGSSEIRILVSDWKVEHGIAQAQDVAMATRENRIALQGGLDFVNKHFNNVTVALIDAEGCAVVEQRIKGTFREPVIEKPNALQTIARPALELLEQGMALITGEKCEVFYHGSVSAPR
jgi:AsmA protein